MRLAPQGITGTSYLEIDYVDPPPPTLRDRLDARQRLHPERAVDGDDASSTPRSTSSTRLHNIDIEGTIANLNTLLVTTNERVAAVDTKAISQRADRVLAKIETHARQPRDQEALRRGCRAARRASRDQRRAQEDAVEPGAAEAARRHGGGGGAGARDPRRSQRQRVARASVADAHPDRPDHRRRRGGSRPSRSTTCARSPTTCAISPKTPNAIPPT